MHFGQFLRQLREENGFGLREFAGFVGVQPSNLSSVESGARKPFRDAKTLNAIANALGMEPNSEDWKTFFNLAADQLVPADIDLSYVADAVPSLLRTISQKGLCSEDLRKLERYIQNMRSVKTHDR